MKPLENVILMHSYEKYDKNYNPSLVSSNNDPVITSLLCFYIQYQCNQVKPAVLLKSQHMAEILKTFYDYQYNGFISLSDAAQLAQLVYDPWESEIKLPYYTVLDLYTNWVKYFRIREIVESISKFKRVGLKEYILNLPFGNTNGFDERGKQGWRAKR